MTLAIETRGSLASSAISRHGIDLKVERGTFYGFSDRTARQVHHHQDLTGLLAPSKGSIRLGRDMLDQKQALDAKALGYAENRRLR